MHGYSVLSRHAQAENMLGIVRDARPVTMPPFFEYLELVLQVPVGQSMVAFVDPGFLENLAQGSLSRKLVGIEAPGDRLPETRMVGAFEQQDLQVRCVDDDENGNRNFTGALQSQSILADASFCCG